MKLKNKGIALFPIDTTSRELEWQLILASRLVDLGWKCIIGHKQIIVKIHEKSQNCLWFGRLPSDTGRRTNDVKVLERGKCNDTRFLYLHDEGGFYYDAVYEDTVKRLHPSNQASKRNIDKILLWGERQKNCLLNNTDLNPDDLLVTGMPRFDLYKKEFDWLDGIGIKVLREKYGDFTLITTKFGFANGSGHLWEDRFLKGVKESSHKEEITVRDEYFEMWSNQMHTFVEMSKMIVALAKANPKRTFVVRPHPSENKIFYEKVFSFDSNIHVIREGSVRKWIKASNMVIHSSCTTGVEAMLSGKPTINVRLKGDDSEGFDIALARDAGVVVSNLPELLSCYIDVLPTQTGTSKKISSDNESILRNFEINSFDSVVSLIVDKSDRRFSTVILPSNTYNMFAKYKLDKGFKKKSIGGKESNRHARLSPIKEGVVNSVVNGYNKVNNSTVKILKSEYNYIVVG